MDMKMSRSLTIVFITTLVGFAALSEQWGPEIKDDPNRQYVDAKNCGTTDDLAQRIEICAKPVLDLVQGTLEKWPKNINDARDLCVSYAGCERCIRENSRKCAQGLHKTIISTVATSVKRVRTRECAESQLPAVLKTTQCFERNKPIVRRLMSNITSHLHVIETEFPTIEIRTNALCCLVSDIETTIKHVVGPLCPEESKMVIRIIRAILDDALNLICRVRKCNNLFKGYKVVQYETNKFGGLVATILRIVFAIGKDG